MKEVLLVKSENKQKVEDILKRDDITSRGSILIKSPSSLDIEEDGIFFILDLSEEAMKHAEKITKDLAIVYKNKKKVLDAVEEQEDSALQGFGNILG